MKSEGDLVESCGRAADRDRQRGRKGGASLSTHPKPPKPLHFLTIGGWSPNKAAHPVSVPGPPNLAGHRHGADVQSPRKCVPGHVWHHEGSRMMTNLPKPTSSLRITTKTGTAAP
jgi:hypothetical protein